MAKKKTRAAKKTAKKTAKSSPKKARVGKPARPARHKSKGTTRAPAASPPPTPAAQQPEAATEANVLALEAVDSLRALTEELGRLRADQAREREERDKDHAAAQAAWSSTQQVVLDIQQRLTRFEESQRQLAEDKSVINHALRLRSAFAGACKFLPIPSPTPAIIGRAMHDMNAFSSNAAVEVVPRKVFESIYAKKGRGVPDHLSPRITTLLEEFESKNSGLVAKDLGNEFDRRFESIKNMDLGEKQEIKHGGKTRYRRVLNEWGALVFQEWPDWNDASGGISFAEPPQPPSAASEESAPSSEAPAGPEQAASVGPPIPPP